MPTSALDKEICVSAVSAADRKSVFGLLVPTDTVTLDVMKMWLSFLLP